jgi:predicted nicotinamide N-methyase
VAGKVVLDLASGSGLVAIAAAKAGAAIVEANDIDPMCEAAVAVNAELNGVSVEYLGNDLLGADPPEADVILAADVFYEEGPARRFLAFLQKAHAAGIAILAGDPGRTYFPRDAFRLVAEYDVETSTEIENKPVKAARVWEL